MHFFAFEAWSSFSSNLREKCKQRKKDVFGSDESGIEKFGFGRVRVYPNFQMSGSGMSGIEKIGFWRVILGSCIPGPITKTHCSSNKLLILDRLLDFYLIENSLAKVFPEQYDEIHGHGTLFVRHYALIR